MKNTLVYTLAAMLTFNSAQAFAHDYTKGKIGIDQPFVLATPKGADSALGYFKIQNEGKDDDQLTGIDAPGIAKTAEIHSASMEDGGIIKMRKMVDGIVIPAGQTITMTPEIFHVMFLGVKSPIVAGKKYEATLHFAKAGDQDVEFAVDDKAGTASKVIMSPLGAIQSAPPAPEPVAAAPEAENKTKAAVPEKAADKPAADATKPKEAVTPAGPAAVTEAPATPVTPEAAESKKKWWQF